MLAIFWDASCDRVRKGAGSRLEERVCTAQAPEPSLGTLESLTNLFRHGQSRHAMTANFLSVLALSARISSIQVSAAFSLRITAQKAPASPCLGTSTGQPCLPMQAGLFQLGQAPQQCRGSVLLLHRLPFEHWHYMQVGGPRPTWKTGVEL